MTEWPHLNHRPGWADVAAVQDLVDPQQPGRVAGRARLPQLAVADRWLGGTYRLTVWSLRIGAPVELQVTDRAASVDRVPAAAAARLVAAGWAVLDDWCRYGDGWRCRVVEAPDPGG